MTTQTGDLYQLDRNDAYSREHTPHIDFTSTFRIMFYDRFELFVDMLMTGGSVEEFQYEKIFKGERIFARVSPLELEKKQKDRACTF